MNLSFLTGLIDAGKLGGWVRAGVASVLGVAIAKWHVLSFILTPEVQDALGVAISGMAVGLWSHVVKAGS
jgi:hypothetical protein